jgi:flagellar biosynthesis protein
MAIYPVETPHVEANADPRQEIRGDLRGAVAIAYHGNDVAPRLVAKGSGLIADEIIRRAREAGVYVHQSRELVTLLMKVDLDQHIPPALYTVVAELLAWLHRTERHLLEKSIVKEARNG